MNTPDPSKPIEILLIEDNPVDARLVEKALKGKSSTSFLFSCMPLLRPALDHLGQQGKPDLVLLDLNLPDSWGLDTFFQVYKQAPDVPIVILSGLDIEDLALRALQAGAQDYLIKGQYSSEILVRSIHYAIRRKQVEQALLESQRERARVETIMQTSVALSHEINNALQIIIGQTEVLLQKIPNTSKDMRRDISIIQDGSFRIAEVLKELAQVTRPVTTTYVGKAQMLDLKRSAGEPQPNSGGKDP